MLSGTLFIILYALLLLLLIKKWSLFSIEGWSKWPIYFALGLKVLFAFVVWLIYTYYYTNRMDADIFKYFDDASVIFAQTQSDLQSRWQLILGWHEGDAALNSILADTQFWDSKEVFLFNDNRNMIRIHLLLMHLSSGVYHLHSLFFASLSLIGSIGIFHFFKQTTKLSSVLLFSCCFLIPSLLFWASAPLKESYILFALGILCLSLMQYEKGKMVAFIGLFILALLLLSAMKIYIIFALMAPIFFFLLSKNGTKNKVLGLFLGTHVLLITAVIYLADAIVKPLSAKQAAFQEIAQLARNPVVIGEFKSLGELVLRIPQALYNVYLRPLFALDWNVFTIMSSLEHILLIGLLYLPLRYFKSPTKKELRLSLFLTSFLLITASVIGLTTPILGAIVRYKAVLIPFYLLLLFTFVDFSKLKRILG